MIYLDNAATTKPDINAINYAKENGRNQIVFKNEIQKLKQERFKESKGEYGLTEEEIALDQKMQYIAIVEPVRPSGTDASR